MMKFSRLVVGSGLLFFSLFLTSLDVHAVTLVRDLSVEPLDGKASLSICPPSISLDGHYAAGCTGTSPARSQIFVQDLNRSGAAARITSRTSEYGQVFGVNSRGFGAGSFSNGSFYQGFTFEPTWTSHSLRFNRPSSPESYSRVFGMSEANFLSWGGASYYAVGQLNEYPSTPVLWHTSNLTSSQALPLPTGSNSGIARAVNSRGLAGGLVMFSGVSHAAFWYPTLDRRSRWPHLRNTYRVVDFHSELVDPTNRASAQSSYVYAINDPILTPATLVGTANFQEGSTLVTYGYYRQLGRGDEAVMLMDEKCTVRVPGATGTMTCVNSAAHSVDNRGRVVGSATFNREVSDGSGGTRTETVTHAFILDSSRENARMVDLNSYLPADSDWVLIRAYGIGGNRVVGLGLYGGVTRPFVLEVDSWDDLRSRE